MHSIFEISRQICDLFLNHANSVQYKMSIIIEIYISFLHKLLWLAQVYYGYRKIVSGIEICTVWFQTVAKFLWPV